MASLPQFVAVEQELFKDKHEFSYSPLRDDKIAPEENLQSCFCIEQLANEMTKNAKIIADLRRRNLAQPSSEQTTPLATLPIESSEKFDHARTRIMEASLRAFKSALGPREYISHLTVKMQHIAALQWLLHFGVLEQVNATEFISYSELSRKVNVSEKQLKTVVRMAMTDGVFCEPRAGYVAHTATSAMLANNSSIRDWAKYMTNVTAPTASKLAEASERWAGSVKKNETAYNIAFNTDLPFFDHLVTMPEETALFASYMKNLQESKGTALHHVLRAYDWAGLGESTVIDVGGSSGATSVALAEVFPLLRFEVQDLADNVVKGRETVQKLGAGIADRIDFRIHDFFTEQPVVGARRYLLRMILHDWPDDEARAILQHLADAMSNELLSRILIMDTLLPPPGSIPSVEESVLRSRDMVMLETFNSSERDLQDWERLLISVSPPLKICGVKQPVGSVLSLLEVERSLEESGSAR